MGGGGGRERGVGVINAVAVVVVVGVGGGGGGGAGQIIIKFWEKYWTSVQRRTTCSPVQFSMLHSTAC